MNKALQILTLVVAIAVLGGAVLLHQKRKLLLERGDILAKQVQQSAKDIDLSSGTKLSTNVAGISNKDLDDEVKMKSFESRAKAIATIVKKVVKQRDDLSASLTTSAEKFRLEYSTETLNKVEEYDAEIQKVLSGFDKVVNRDKTLIDTLVSVANTTDLEVTEEGLKTYEEVPLNESVKLIEDKVNYVVKKNKVMANDYAHIAEILELNSPDLEGNYEASLSTFIGDVTDFKTNFDNVKSELASAKDKLTEAVDKLEVAKGDVKKLTKENKDLSKRVAYLDAKFREYSGMNSADEAIAKLEAIGKDYYKLLDLVEAKILKINEKWGFAVINFGKESRVISRVGTLTKEFEVKIPVGTVMDITRTVDGSQEYVGQFEVTKVEGGFTVGKLINTAANFKAAIGDDVYFSPTTIASMKTKDINYVEEEVATSTDKPADAKNEVKKDDSEQGSDADLDNSDEGDDLDADTNADEDEEQAEEEDDFGFGDDLDDLNDIDDI